MQLFQRDDAIADQLHHVFHVSDIMLSDVGR